MSRWFTVLSVALLSAASVRAQTAPVGSCELGTAEGVLDTEQLRATVYNTGALFWRGSGTTYDIPKDVGATPIFSASLWVSGFVEGDLRIAASEYGPWEFWPGPVDHADAPPGACSAYDRIWTVSRQDIARYLVTGEATADLLDWPHALGAPVLDGDGDPTNYDLAAGDQPDLLGDMAAWWVMNDVGNTHDQTDALPLGVEVRVQAFVLDQGFQSLDLRTDSFYRYTIVNRRDVPLDSVRISMFFDPDLGDATDDFVGTDTLRQMMYVYNGDDFDGVEPYESGGAYGDVPPAFGVQILRGPVGLPNGRDDDYDGETDEADEVMRMTSAPPYWKNSGQPQDAPQYVNIQRGLYRDGTPVRAYGTGLSLFGPTFPTPLPPTTRFAYPGDPIVGEFWAEVNTDGAGAENTPADRYAIVNTGPVTLAPGDSAVVDLAMVFAQDVDRFGSVRALKTKANAYLSLFRDGTFDSSLVTADEYREPEPPGPEPPETFPVTPAITRVRPNPSTGDGAATLTLPESGEAEVAVYDLLGRRLAVIVSGTLPAGETRLAVPRGLLPGVYVLRARYGVGDPVGVPFTVVPPQ